MKPSWLVMKLMLPAGPRPLAQTYPASRAGARPVQPAAGVIAAPEPPHAVTIAVVPFATSAAGKPAQLIAARARVPGFGDQPGAGKCGSSVDGGKQRVGRVEASRVPRPSTGARSKRKPSTPMLPVPVAQAVQHQVLHARVVSIQRIAAAGIVDVLRPAGRAPCGSRPGYRCRAGSGVGPMASPSPVWL